MGLDTRGLRIMGDGHRMWVFDDKTGMRFEVGIHQAEIVYEPESMIQVNVRFIAIKPMEPINGS